MLFVTIYLVCTGGKGGLVSVSTQSPYTPIIWAFMALVAFLMVLLFLTRKGPVAWDEEDEDDQFYDDN